MSGEAMLVAVVCVGLWWAGSETVSGIKKANHFIAAKFHHRKTTNPSPSTEKD